MHVIIHNENFVIYTSFFYYLTFYESSYSVQLTQFLINTLLSKKWNKKEQDNKYTKKFFWILKFNGGILDIAECNILGIMRFCYGLTKSVILWGICLVLKFRGNETTPNLKGPISNFTFGIKFFIFLLFFYYYYYFLTLHKKV